MEGATRQFVELSYATATRASRRRSAAVLGLLERIRHNLSVGGKPRVDVTCPLVAKAIEVPGFRLPEGAAGERCHNKSEGKPSTGDQQGTR